MHLIPSAPPVSNSSSSILTAVDFCQVCKDLFRNREGSSKKDMDSMLLDLKAATYGALKISAKIGCDQCQLIVGLIIQYCDRESNFSIPNDTTQVWLVEEGRFPWKPGQRISFQFGNTFRSISPQFYVLSGEKSPWLDWAIPTHDHLCGDTSSEQALDTVRKWLQNCQDSHQTCPPAQVAVLPSRTVFVGSSNHQIRLSQNQGRQDRYLCLSHCWGHTQPLRTTRLSIAEHIKAIEWSSLPKTFQDAVDFTRRLGFSHIWIDSLCIIQDDDQDWSIESGQMATIYANAYLTLAAVASRNGTEGLYRPCTQLTVSSELRIAGEGRESRVVHALEDRELVHVGPQPLLIRGWFFQENYLSPRLLCFNEHEISMKCKTQTRCECSDAFCGDAKVLLNLPTSSWAHVARNYCVSQLSFQKDKLPALSGVARTFQNNDSSLGSYYAGLWELNLVHQWAWFTSDQSKSRTCSQQNFAQPYIAPSWSWTSVDGRIFNIVDPQARPSTGLLCVAEVLEAHCETALANPFGRVFGAYMDLKISFFPACNFGATSWLKQHWRNPLLKLQKRDLSSPFRTLPGVGPTFDDITETQHIDRSNLDLYCGVLWISSEGPWNQVGKTWEVSLLMLKPALGNGKEWRRVGYSKEWILTEQLDEFVKLCDKSVQTIRIV